jgi:hypothetical protein
LAHVGTFVEAVGHGGVRCDALDRYAVGKQLGGSDCKGDVRSGLIVDGELSCSAIFNDLNLPEVNLGVAPPSQDCLAVECDFTACFVKEYFAARIAQDGNREEIVDKAGKLMC